MEFNVKISVIIPAYNIAEWLPRCIESVLNQTYTNLEIILIDDGSSDATVDIVDVYAQKDSRIVAVHQENAGLVAVREKGIALATGEYVSFVDGDDVIEQDFLQRLLSNAMKYDADISHCGMKYCFYDGRVKLHYGTGEVTVYDNLTGMNELLRCQKIEPSLCNKLYRRDLLPDSCLDTSIVNNEDLLRNFILFKRANRSVFEDFCGYQYWRRAESMSNSGFKAKACYDVLKARALILEHANEETQETAKQSYINALISSYNSTIGVPADDAEKLQQYCKKELKRFKSDLNSLPRNLYLRAVAILCVPAVYHGLFKLHKINVQRKIRIARKNAQKA